MTAPPVFPFTPEEDSKPQLSYEFLTDVMSSSENKEIRQALREIALRRYSYPILLQDAAAVADFRHAWYSPDRPLRYLSPLWNESALLTSISGDLLTGDFAGRDFAIDGFVLVYSVAGLQEIGVVADLSDGLITLEDPLVGTFTPGLTRVAPAMVGWLTPPVFEGKSAEANRVEISFIEELRGIAGLDDTLTEIIAAVPASLELFWIHGSQPYRPVYTIALAIVKDANGARIPNAIIEWSYVDGDLVDNPDDISPSLDTQSCRVEQGHNGGFLTATIGTLTQTIQFIAGP
jgi:hypothetical protein